MICIILYLLGFPPIEFRQNSGEAMSTHVDRYVEDIFPQHFATPIEVLPYAVKTNNVLIYTVTFISK